jgi:hypothetical protein
MACRTPQIDEAVAPRRIRIYWNTPMNLPALATPSQAKAVWDRMDHPSTRRVARALTQSGRPVHFSTVARWKLQGWRSMESGPHPLEMARRSIDVALPVLTGDAKDELVARIHAIVRRSKG